jgi:D-aminoacyl-tRNA deacylase
MTNPKPIFTVHTPGTWPDVSVSNPHLVSAVFRALCKYAYEPFTCAFEATHHPPNTSAVSATFVEVGSTESEWTDRKAVDVLLHSVEEALGGVLPENPPAMVVGDLHYVTVADMALRGEVDLGHVVPKYVEITLGAVRTAYRKHTTPVKKAVVFRKNVKNPTRGEVVEFLKSQGVEVVLKG